MSHLRREGVKKAGCVVCSGVCSHLMQRGRRGLGVALTARSACGSSACRPVLQCLRILCRGGGVAALSSLGWEAPPPVLAEMGLLLHWLGVVQARISTGR